MTDFDRLIDNLADDAAPVVARRDRDGRRWLAAAAAATLTVVALWFGLRPDILRMAPQPMIAIAAGLMAILAVAAGTSAVRMARPQVGAAASSAPWLAAALMMMPLAALAAIAAQPAEAAGLALEPGLRCLRFGLVSGLASMAALTLWLNRGAPVAPERAAWLVGLAGGAIGALMVTLECPHDPIAHLGVWHVAVVPVAAVAARLALPRFLRW
jgi:hypothetical protein